MPNVPTAPTTGATVQPDTHHVMAWVSPGGTLAHLLRLTSREARTFASQLTMAAEVADQMTERENRS